MEQLIKRMTEESVWQKWVAANSAQGDGAKDGCISAAPKSGCISAAPKAGCIS
ncbi:MULTISPECIES: hypothetical protein [Streptomyces]|uniref:hypothetical protein n=1 Tax=Streptomyces TaxID=1883 RepID=UPI0022EEEF3C|nr:MULTISPECIES: hypothetical protein [Streptomyces]WFB86707.1 hypothetical protein MMU79_27060 [Streptomyces olivaceus]WGK46305.1 hypothetical protein M6G09_12160 [Streptomyces sp. B146]GHI95558.1 hypothetical protein TPA0905_50290 [Streptomyces olivaceus]